MRPDATYTDDLYRFDYATEQVVVKLDRLQERSRGGGITCELTIESSAEPNPGVLHGPKNFNLLTSSTALANDLTRRRDDIDWEAMLGQVSAAAVKRWREGEPMIDLATFERGEAPKYLLPPLIESRGVTVVAAGGGTGKSMLGIACAMTVATGIPFLGIEPLYQCPVAYLDWEADPDTHQERMQALWRGYGAPGAVPPELMLYRRHVASLSEAGSVLRRQIAERSVRFAVVDSVGMARGGAPEDAETTIRLFVAMRSLNIPILAIDHMSKDALNNGKGEPIGSVYTTNSARRVFVMRSAEMDGRTGVSIKNVKANNGRLAAPIGYQVDFNEDALGNLTAVRYTASSLFDLPTEVQTGGQKYELLAYLKREGGRAPLHEVAEALHVTASNLGNLIRRNDEWFVRVDDSVALLDKEHSL